MDPSCCQDNLGWYLSRDATPVVPTGSNFESLWAYNLWASNAYVGNAAMASATISNLTASNLGSYAFCNLIGNANASTTGLLSNSDWIRFDTGRSNYGVLTASNLSASNLGSYAFCNLIATANSSTTGLLSSTDWIRFDAGGAARSNYGMLTAADLSASNAAFSNLSSSNLTVNVSGQSPASFNVINTGTSGVALNMTGSGHSGRVIVQDANLAIGYSNSVSGVNYFPLVARGSVVEVGKQWGTAVTNVMLKPDGGAGEVKVGDAAARCTAFAPLQVFGTDAGGMRLDSSSTGSYYHCFSANTGRFIDMGLFGTDYFVNVNGTWRLVINATNGATFMTGIRDNFVASGSANVTINGATGLLQRIASSRRYKTNIRYQDAPNYNVLDLKPCLFDNATNPDDRDAYGMIAEDCADHGVEEIVVRDEKGRPDSIAYDRVGVMLIPVVRELRRVLQQQRQHIEELQQRVLFLEA